MKNLISMHPTYRRAHAGFTLIELMIVIGIIVVIAAVLVVSFGGVFTKRDNTVAEATIKTLVSNLQSYQAKWHSFPASSIEALGAQTRGSIPIMDPNEVNRGNETMVYALRSRKNGGPFLASDLFNNDDYRKNTDSDTLNDNPLDAEGSLDLFEIVDPWGSPYVYLNINDLRNGAVKDGIRLDDGTDVELGVQELQDKLKHPTTGQYPQGFVIWSFGPDKKNDYGRGDDITSWPKYQD